MDLLEIKHKCRSNFNEYLRKALGCINHTKQMNALDIGCGTGVSVLEIAKRTNWQIIAVEPDEHCLLFLNNKIQELNLIDKVETVHGSIEEVQFPGKKFDVILAEGLFNIIGFDKGFTTCSYYLKNNGFMIIHDELKDRENKLKIFSDKGFNLITSFILNEKIWWDKYYSCMEKQIHEFERVKQQIHDTKKYFGHEKAEIEMYKVNPLNFQSVYYVVQKSKD